MINSLTGEITMAFPYAVTVEELGSTRAPNSNYADVAQAHVSAVSWGAIVAEAGGHG